MVDERRSLSISRRHFLVEQCDETHGRLLDVSSGGTAVDGAALSKKDSFFFDVGKEADVTLAPALRGGGVLSMHLRAVPDARSASAVAGAILTRTDSVPESYLPMWGEADLGAWDAALRGRIVQWDGNRFVMRDASGIAGFPCVGWTFGPPDAPFRIIPFRQFGILNTTNDKTTD